MIELHYTTSLESTNTVAGSTGVDATDFTYSNPANQIDVVNMGGGFYANFSNGATMYMGVVAPLGTGTKRFFDTEAQVSINVGY